MGAGLAGYGSNDGWNDGTKDGSRVGCSLGSNVERLDRTCVGSNEPVGLLVGRIKGGREGITDGAKLNSNAFSSSIV
jgi:hypothetical protein